MLARFLPVLAGAFVVLTLGAASTFPSPAWAADDTALDGTWVLSLPRSGPHRGIQETVVIAHEGEDEIYSAEVTFNGQVSGVRYRARPDGKPYPLLDLKTGVNVGVVTVSPKKPGVWNVNLAPSDLKRPRVNIEHWTTQGGAALISLLKDEKGEVTSVLVFERR